MKHLFLRFVFFAFASLHAQTVDSVFFSQKNTQLPKLLPKIEKKYRVTFSYVDSLVQFYRINLSPKHYVFDDLLKHITSQTSLNFQLIDSGHYAITQNSLTKIEKDNPEKIKEILITYYISKGIRKENNGFSLKSSQKEILPGINGSDIFQTLQQFPGIISPHETTTGLHIRGSTPDQNLILWNDIRVYHAGHLFGMISPFHSTPTQKTYLYLHNIPLRYGERISGIVDIVSKEQMLKKPLIATGVNMLNADVSVGLPLIYNRWDVLFSIRQSVSRFWQSPTFNAISEKVLQNTSVQSFNENDYFDFNDISLKTDFRLNPKNIFSASGLYINSNLNYTEDNTPFFNRLNIQNSGFSTHWKHHFTDSFQQSFMLYGSQYNFLNESQNTSNFEYQKKNRLLDSGIALDYSWQHKNQFYVNFGIQLKNYDTSHTFNANSDLLLLILNAEHLIQRTVGSYLELAYNNLKFGGQLGYRYNDFFALGHKADPKLSFYFRWHPNFKTEWVFEQKSQVLTQIRESATNELSLENNIWTLVDGKKYPALSVIQGSLNLTYQPKNWLIDTILYYKIINGVTSYTFGFLNLQDNELHQGNSLVKGFNTLLQYSKITQQYRITYSFNDVKNRFNNLNQNNYFNTTALFKHNLYFAYSKTINNWQFVFNWNWHSGKPYQIIDDSGNVDFNSIQYLPSYHRLDASVFYDFYFGKNKNRNLQLGVVLQNIYNRKNPINREYLRDYGTINGIFTNSYGVKDYYGVRFTPNLFLKFQF